MNGIGMLVNVLAVLVGGFFGLIIQGRMKVKYQKVLSQFAGLLVMGVGIYGCVGTYFDITDTNVEMEGMLMVLFALLCGGAIGVAIHLEKILYALSKVFRKTTDKEERKKEELRRRQLRTAIDKASAQGRPLPPVSFLDRFAVYEMPSERSGSLFGDGFLAATLVVCTNAMLLSGVYADCFDGEHKTLLIKAAIDLVICAMLAFVYGGGVLYAVGSLVLTGGGLTGLFLLADASESGSMSSFVTWMFTPSMMGQLSLIGGIMMIGVGACLAFEKKFKIVNLFPAFFIPVICKIIMHFF